MTHHCFILKKKKKKVRFHRPEVDICSLDGVEQELGNPHPLHVDEMRLEKGLRSPKPFPTHLHLSPIRELQKRDGKSQGHIFRIKMSRMSFTIATRRGVFRAATVNVSTR